MTRKDFVTLSSALRDVRDAAPLSPASYKYAIDVTVRAIAKAIAQDHTGFDQYRFLQDIGTSQI